MNDNIEGYSIEVMPIEPILKRYVNSNDTKQHAFIFTSKEGQSEDVIKRIYNSGFYEKFSKWIEENNDKGIFPKLENGLEPLEVEVTSTAYALSVSQEMAKFQIKLRLKYLKRERI